MIKNFSYLCRLLFLSSCAMLMTACDPWANFVVSPSPVVVGVEATFDASSSIGNPSQKKEKEKEKDEIVSYSWVLGDGTTASGKIIKHTYQIEGTYTATLTTTTRKGKTDSATQQIVVKPAPVPRVNATISSLGGSITLPNYASVTFPAGSFPSSQPVTLSATSTQETALDFEAGKGMFGEGERTAYELRLNTGKVKATLPFDTVITVPKNFLDKLPADSEIKVFAQIFEEGGEDVLDHFQLFESVYSATNGTVTVSLPPEAFTNKRRVDGTFEAIMVLVTTPTKPSTLKALAPQTSSVVSVLDARPTTGIEQILPMPTDAIFEPPNNTLFTTLATVAASCQGSSLGSPIENRQITGAFNPPVHSGTDYRASIGTQILSMADGVIDRVGFDERALSVPDPRSGKLVKGWGQYVVVKHSDGSRSLYAHLQKDGALKKSGDPVTQGEAIALSGNTGGSSGPHLHVEYAPNGKIYDKTSKVDAEPCIDLNGKGSITVSDNGSIADDAFSVAINGLVVCRTSIGAANTCAIGNLRPGTATLTLTAIIAPDDVGTYLISLADSLTFADGTNSRSGTLPQGGSASFSITIPPK